MKRILAVLALIAAGAGCVTVSNSVLPAGTAARPSDRVTLGMTRAAVAAIMDTRVVVGYEIDPASGFSRAVETQSLYSSEIVKLKGVDYQIDRYMVRPSLASARLAETELFPVAYKAGLVVAAGREGVDALLASGAPARAGQ